MTATVFFIILAMSLLTVAGDFMLKIASEKASMFHNVFFIGGLLIYALSAFGWTLAFRHLKMASVGAVYSMFIIILLVFIGWIAFKERLSWTEWLGLSLALMSIGLPLRHS